MGFAPDFCDIHASGQKPLQVPLFSAVVEPFERRKSGRKRTFTFTLRDGRSWRFPAATLVRT